MYRIRLASGAETTYHSMDEFAVALQGGTVTAEALIYHQRADRWLSVTNHPHYQIALSRAASTGAATATNEASKRQVISAVRPAATMPPTRIAPREVPPTAARAQIFDVVAEMETASEAKVPKKLTIPTSAPKKVDSPLRAQENVLNGVVINKPKPAEPNKTSALPVRAAPTNKPPVTPPAPRVPDLGEGLDLVEDIIVESPAPTRASTATPQVDKLLEMLEPHPAAAPAKHPAFRGEDFELLDLHEPLPKKAPLHLEVAPAAQPQHLDLAAHHAPIVSVSRPKQNSKMLAVAGAAVLAIGVAVFLWKPWAASALPEGSEIASTTLPRTEAFGGSTAEPTTNPENPATEVAPGGTPADSARIPAKPAADSGPSIVRVAAPRNMSVPLPTANLVASGGPAKNTIGAGVLIQHYNAAYTEARSELELRMLQIGFTQIFLRSRLTTSAGVQDTRRLITSASAALRQYRSQENQIERGYQDTVGVAGRNLGWTPRDLGAWNTKTGQKESGETLRLTNLMLSQMDSTFSLLAEQEGKYQVSGDAITFENPEASRQYGALRVWLNQQADKYSGTGDALPATLRQVVKAMGATRLPHERR